MKKKSRNGSDNNISFHDAMHLQSRSSAPIHTTSSTSISSASLTASRKRKLLEQFLLPGNGSSSNTISLSEMRTLGLVGQSRPSATVQPTTSTSTTSNSTTASINSTRSPVGGLNFSTVSGYVPSLSFYQARTFGTPSCSGGGSTESLCSSTADSACGHPPDLPDDGNLATPGPVHDLDVSIIFFFFFYLFIFHYFFTILFIFYFFIIFLSFFYLFLKLFFYYYCLLLFIIIFLLFVLILIFNYYCLLLLIH